jgi:hypothetical protein
MLPYAEWLTLQQQRETEQVLTATIPVGQWGCRDGSALRKTSDCEYDVNLKFTGVSAGYSAGKTFHKTETTSYHRTKFRRIGAGNKKKCRRTSNSIFSSAER